MVREGGQGGWSGRVVREGGIRMCNIQWYSQYVEHVTT